MSDKDPLGAMIRELAPVERFIYLLSEVGHAWVNMFTETFRKLNVPAPQMAGKAVGVLIPILVIALVYWL